MNKFSNTEKCQLSWRESKQKRQKIAKTVAFIILSLGAIVYAMPFLWMVRTALMKYEQVIRMPPVWFPYPIQWHNFKEALKAMDFFIQLRNTIILTTFGLIGQLISTSIVAFGFARLNFPGRDTLFYAVLSTMMLPAMVTEIPKFILFTKLKWIDTFYPIIVPAFFAGSAFFIFLLRQFFKTIPQDLDDAARIDGCSSFRIFTTIILPLSKPALATVGIFGFIWYWNDFWGPLVYLRSAEMKTLALGLQLFQGRYMTEYHYLMSASLVVLLPVLIIFVVAQRYFVRGIILTGLKA